MPDKNKDQAQPKNTQREGQKPFKDLDTKKADMDRVKGGRAVAADPCAGGE